MTLNERIIADMQGAMKAQNVSLLSVLRMLKSAIMNQQIALGHDLSDVEVLSTLEKQAKQRRDSIEQYKAGNREDLAANEQAELTIIESYLPQKMSNEDLSKIVEEAIAETGATTMSDMGNVIKIVMAKAAGAADGGQVANLVKEKLA